MSISVKDIVPPFIYTIYGLLKPKKYGWLGNYPTWEEAQKACGGYDSDIIVEKVRYSLLRVKNGEVAYERDGVVFENPEYAWPLLSALLLAYSQKQTLNVLDFGGSLGSTYFQHKKLFTLITSVRWNVVEQTKFVEIGKKDFQSDVLKFFYTVEECLVETSPNVLLLGSVLQYIEKPYELLTNLFSHNFEYVIINRTPFAKDNQHRITVQKVHPSIYNASYPSHLFSESEFISYIERSNYELIAQYSPENEIINELYLLGFILKLKNDK